MTANVHHASPRTDSLANFFRSPKLVYSTFLMAMAFFTFGYDGAISGGILAMVPFVNQISHTRLPNGTPYLTSTDISIMTALPVTGCVLGLPLAAQFADKYGRKKMILVGCIFSAVGSAIQTAAFGLAEIVVGRWIANVAIWLFIVLGSTYMAEIAPENVRGAIVGTSIVLINTAAIVASGVNWSMSTEMSAMSFRLPLGLGILFPLILFVGLFFVDDSPTWYLTKSRDSDALRSLRSVRSGYPEAEILAEFAALKAQASIREDDSKVPWIDIFRGTNLRRSLLAMSIGNMQQLSGIAFATNYATIFLATVSGNVSPFLLTMVGAILAFAGAVTGIYLVDRVGRRTLALSTFTMVFCIDLVVGVLGFMDYTGNPSIAKAIASMCMLFSFFFAAGFGPLTYVVSAEIPTARLRNKTSSFSFLTLAAFSTVVIYVLPYISQPDAGNLGPKTYLVFAGWMAGCIIITYLYLPETKGRTPAELDAMFEARVPARKFKDYQCNLSMESYMNEEKIEAEIAHHEAKV
ncbi:High-affinity glucose transporter RGT2 [Fusarium oxysporum f. sp. cubense race 1]|uniref:High-affinity glucose transporter RGT2 n=1 Tax=Fusarium oxysporum f. sp. cubense (strain race 1) TaxID=1229664 RepID=N4U030_FUSC1|nr:High-affinity glucose transporter RGT2 [Fusarium oxysporum f. sp. cubense race 1]